jgi:hypothetical protein
VTRLEQTMDHRLDVGSDVAGRGQIAMAVRHLDRVRFLGSYALVRRHALIELDEASDWS